jgi:hypothetical protein
MSKSQASPATFTFSGWEPKCRPVSDEERYRLPPEHWDDYEDALLFTIDNGDGLAQVEGVAYDKAKAELKAAQDKVAAEPTALTKRRDSLRADLSQTEKRLAEATQRAAALDTQLHESAESGDVQRMNDLAAQLATTRQIIPVLEKRQQTLAESHREAELAAERELHGRLAVVQRDVAAVKERELDAASAAFNKAVTELLTRYYLASAASAGVGGKGRVSHSRTPFRVPVRNEPARGKEPSEEQLRRERRANLWYDPNGIWAGHPMPGYGHPDR